MGRTLLSATHWPEFSYQTPLTQGEMEGVKPGYDPRGEGASRSVTSSTQEAMAQLGALVILCELRGLVDRSRAISLTVCLLLSASPNRSPPAHLM